MTSHPPGDDDRHRSLVNLVVAAVVVALLVVGVWLTNALVRQSKMEDCLMAHRRNCRGVDAEIR